MFESEKKNTKSKSARAVLVVVALLTTTAAAWGASTDVVVTRVSAPPRVRAGDTVEVVTTLRNTGRFRVGPLVSGIYLSHNTTVNALRDPLIGVTTAPQGLRPGQELSRRTLVTIPEQLRNGRYHIAHMTDLLSHLARGTTEITPASGKISAMAAAPDVTGLITVGGTDFPAPYFGAYNSETFPNFDTAKPPYASKLLLSFLQIRAGSCEYAEVTTTDLSPNPNNGTFPSAFNPIDSALIAKIAAFTQSGGYFGISLGGEVPALADGNNPNAGNASIIDQCGIEQVEKILTSMLTSLQNHGAKLSQIDFDVENCYFGNTDCPGQKGTAEWTKYQSIIEWIKDPVTNPDFKGIKVSVTFPSYSGYQTGYTDALRDFVRNTNVSVDEYRVMEINWGTHSAAGSVAAYKNGLLQSYQQLGKPNNWAKFACVIDPWNGDTMDTMHARQLQTDLVNGSYPGLPVGLGLTYNGLAHDMQEGYGYYTALDSADQ